MTRYRIFRYRQGENPDTWEEVEKDKVIGATSPKRALQVAELKEGLYVAVPARSWKELHVKVEQTTKVTIG